MNQPIGLVNTPVAGVRFVDNNGCLTVDGKNFLDRLLAAVQGSEAYSVSNVVADRSYDAAAPVLGEIAMVLGTLIQDLQAKEILT